MTATHVASETIEPETIPTVVAAAARRFGEAESLVEGDRRMSFTALDAEMRRVCRSGLAVGVKPGDRVAIWAPNSLEWLIAYVGMLACGAAVVPINTRFKGLEAASSIRKSEVSTLFTVGDFLDADYVGMLRDAAPDLAGLRTILLDEGIGSHADVLAWSAFLDSGEPVDPAEADAAIGAVTPDQLSHILFTSGATGEPKGVLGTHGQYVTAAGACARAQSLVEGERTFSVLPMFHIFGIMNVFLPSLLVGGTFVLESVFDPGVLLRTVERERITYLPGPPAISRVLLEHPDAKDHDLSSLRKILLASTTIEPELVRKVIDTGLASSVFTAWGLTEAGGPVSFAREGDPVEKVATTAGRPIEGVEVRVVGDDGAELAQGEDGELLVRGPGVMKGYVADPKGTAAVLEPDGWLHTGDVGRFDADGYVQITGRKKDLFIVGGFNASPAEIEGILATHPDIVEAAVVGMPDARLEEVAAAFIVLKPGSEPTAESIVEWSRANMANYKVPRYVEFLPELPRNAQFKVLKHVLRERLPTAGQAPEALASPQG